MAHNIVHTYSDLLAKSVPPIPAHVVRSRHLSPNGISPPRLLRVILRHKLRSAQITSQSQSSQQQDKDNGGAR
ncbi:hypothetical protein NEUTE1DRAFT_135836 [Neurospora tetrasperma FGSC 2508]|uniref:Uncharacterized protein n=1 Tax=Neurospora tetrasperma (strain FGSC 2508 / ATCC MYA-4615 / P0657) TaxID=510951 RepID=F8MH72_NEUT8|nr:uncharacterized protein NEUTE1DRAFT_135836 [Neurospora tetrasperma FGSC 2508]EGO58737.1 hypothetical protein NEUTE1DRAFT_135836 [Neurospora tetrasperma FGSC 2508]